MIKRALSMMLVLCMAVSLFAAMPVNVSAASNGTCGDNLTWTLDDEGTLTISGTGKMSNYYSSSVPLDSNSNETIYYEWGLEPTITYGDVNNDGVIDVSDVVMLVEYIGTISAGGTLDEITFFPGGKESAMLTADDVINVNDVVLLVEYIGTISAGGALDSTKFPNNTFPGANK